MKTLVKNCRNDGNWSKGTRTGRIFRFITKLVRWMIGMSLGDDGRNKVQEPLGTIWFATYPNSW